MMNEHTTPAGMTHGGMVAWARARFPNAPEPFVDLSTGINPHAYPLAAAGPAAATRLPEPADLAALQRAAAVAYGVADPAMVAAFPGTQSLISLLPFVLPDPGARVAVLSPCYSEHAASWRAGGHLVTEVGGLEALADHDIAVLCNPNNPDGLTHTRATLLQVAARVRLLVVDEAFADLESEVESMASGLVHPSLLVLRSFGKTYGLAGLRLGFALTHAERAGRLRRAIGPWAISGPALAAGLQALPDESWRLASIARLSADIARLDAMLSAHGLKPIGGTRLFRLARHHGAASLWGHLGAQGILARRFDDQPDRLRFGVPGDAAAWHRLETALASYRNQMDVAAARR